MLMLLLEEFNLRAYNFLQATWRQPAAVLAKGTLCSRGVISPTVSYPQENCKNSNGMPFLLGDCLV